MTKRKREQSRREEIANSVSHGVGLIAALAGTPILLISAAQHGDPRFIAGVSIFVATVILLYLASTLYHALLPGQAKRVFRVIEHSAIYFLIAGTYTPFTLGILRGAWGWTLLGVIWALVVVGVALEVLARSPHRIVSTSLYLLMGWIIVVALKPLSDRGLPPFGLLLLVAGGVAYTAGVVFYATDSRLRYGHFLWHLFVMAGTTCHYFAVLWYAV